MLPPLSVVLVSPRNPLNIGAAARALSNFGILDMRLVDPYRVAVDEARSAVKAHAVLEQAREYPTIAAAVADCSLVVGTTAGSNRHLEIPHERLEIAVRDIKARVVPTAILFGSEKFGLSNEDISHCHLTMAIPSRDEHRSMNLGQAVAVTLYEFIRDGDAPSIKGTPDRTAQLEDMERLSELLGEALTLSGFTKPPTTTSSALKLRRMVNRMGLSKSDAIHWQGMMRQMLWKMRNPE